MFLSLNKLYQSIYSQWIISCLDETSKFSPVYKTKDLLDKANYRPVSDLPLLSMIYERLIFHHLSRHAKKVLSKLPCGFRKARSNHHALLRLLHSWQKALDNSDYVGIVLMDLSKACDCIPQDLLIAKLEAYDLDKTSLHLLRDHLSNRNQRT